MNSLTQVAYSFFQLVPNWAFADIRSLSIVARGQGWAGVQEAFIHVCRGEKTKQSHMEAVADGKTRIQYC